MSGNTYVTVVYASPPLTGGDTQRFAEGVDGSSDAYNTRIPVSLSLNRAGRVGLLKAAPTIKFAGAILVVLAATVLMQ